jgi:hypothetical protein
MHRVNSVQQRDPNSLLLPYRRGRVQDTVEAKTSLPKSLLRLGRGACSLTCTALLTDVCVVWLWLSGVTVENGTETVLPTSGIRISVKMEDGMAIEVLFYFDE